MLETQLELLEFVCKQSQKGRKLATLLVMNHSEVSHLCTLLFAESPTERLPAWEKAMSPSGKKHSGEKNELQELGWQICTDRRSAYQGI